MAAVVAAIVASLTLFSTIQPPSRLSGLGSRARTVPEEQSPSEGEQRAEASGNAQPCVMPSSRGEEDWAER